MAVGEKPEFEPQKRGGAKGQVIRAVQLNLGRPSTREDIIWDVVRTEEKKFKCTASVPHLGLVAVGAVCDDRKLAEKAAAEAMVPLITGLPTGQKQCLVGMNEQPSRTDHDSKLEVQTRNTSSDNSIVEEVSIMAAPKTTSDGILEIRDVPARYEHLWQEDPAAETCLSEEVCALIQGDIVYAWRCCLGIGRIRELPVSEKRGLNLDGLYEELCVWGFGLRSTMLFDDSIPFQITANSVQCRSEPVRRILEEVFQRLKRFHNSLGDLQHFTSPFEVIDRWAASSAIGLPIVMLGGHRPVKEFVDRHPELPCTTVSACRKRADSTYGKTLPFDAFAVVNTIYRTKALQMTRLENFMKQHHGRVRAVLNYDPNIEVLSGEASYFKCFTEKRELALMLHGMLASWPESLRRSSIRGAARAVLALLPLIITNIRKLRTGSIWRIWAFAIFAESLNAVACICTWRISHHHVWLRKFAFYDWVRRFPGVPSASISWLTCNVFLCMLSRAGNTWAMSEVCRSGALVFRAIGIMICYPNLIRGFQLHYERELRCHGTVTVRTSQGVQKSHATWSP